MSVARSPRYGNLLGEKGLLLIRLLPKKNNGECSGIL
jgi:hypothetical protein